MGNPNVKHLTVDQVSQRVLELGLLEERQLHEVWSSLGSRSVSLNDFLQTLIRRELLTNYQVERLIKGDRAGFFYGRYKALYLVGSGTFARVFRAVHRDTGRVVALKVLRNRYSDHIQQANQFLREGQVGCTLSHPNIVPVFEVLSESKTYVIVMEFIEGRNLREFVRIRKKIEPLEATRLMAGITDGMRCAFEHGMTHRDLKLSNVLVSSRGEAKLVDFGLAAMDETLTDEKLVDLPNVRTIDYAALERATGVRRNDPRSDLYFLGCMYYHMLTGKPALLETRDQTLRLSKQRFLTIDPIQSLEPSLPLAVTAVVNKAMMFDPARRYQSPSAMLVDLRIATKHLTAGTDIQGIPSNDPLPVSEVIVPEDLPTEKPSRLVMVVESDAMMQNAFREGFKRDGFRVLMTSDPAHAMERLHRDASGADCIVINAQLIGEPALEMFNQLEASETTKRIPALLLLDEPQHAWQSQVNKSPNRFVLFLPITMRQLRIAVLKMLQATSK
jgi:serine/threonine-protein kinase